MWSVENRFKIILGGNTYIDVENLVVCKNETLFTLKRRENDGQLAISMDIYDPHGSKIATIRNNQIVHGDEENYQFIRKPDQWAVIDRTSEAKICDIRRGSQAPSSELEVSVELFTKNRFLFIASPDGTNVEGINMRGNIIDGAKVGIDIL